MNLTKLFETQRKLDDRIVKEKRLEGQDLLPEKILALQVELGELANEWRGFKFWSKDRQPRINEPFNVWVLFDNQEVPDIEYRNLVLEEYVDCLHFILSIGLYEGLENFSFQGAKDEYLENGTDFSGDGVVERFSSTFLYISIFKEKGRADDFIRIFLSFLGLGEMLGFTWEQIEIAYYDKNKINHERQASGY
ncbi:dUTP diphosphatase [Mammaliicoccus sciuri]